MQVQSIRQYLDSSKRKVYIHAICFVGLAVIIGLMNTRYAYNVFFGPFKMTSEQLAGLKNPDTAWQYYVTVSSDGESILTPYYDKEVRKKKYSDDVISEKITDYYQLLPLDKGALLVRTQEDKPAKTFTGEIGSMPEDIGSALRKELDEAQPGLSKAMFPLLLEQNDSFSGILYLAFTFMGVFLIFALVNVLKARALGGDLHKGLLANSLQKHGTPRDLISEIDTEFGALGLANTDAGAIAISNTWILVPEDHHLRAIKLSDVVWAFRTQTKESFNFISSTSDALVIYTKDKRKVLAKNSCANVDLAVAAISVRAPWVYAGYSGKLDLAWQSRANELIAEVEENERQYRRTGSTEPTA